MLPAQLTIAAKYDHHSLAGVTNLLFVRRWAPLFPYRYIAILVVGLTAAVVAFVIAKDPMSGTVLLALVFCAALIWAAVWYRMYQLVHQLVGSQIEFSFNEHQLMVQVDGDRKVFEWTDFSEFERQPRFVLLYVTRATGVVIPTNVLSPDIIELISRKVRAAS